MNVSLTPELDAFVEQAVNSGRYGSASEAVREGASPAASAPGVKSASFQNGALTLTVGSGHYKFSVP